MRWLRLAIAFGLVGCGDDATSGDVESELDRDCVDWKVSVTTWERRIQGCTRGFVEQRDQDFAVADGACMSAFGPGMASVFRRFDETLPRSPGCIQPKRPIFDPLLAVHYSLQILSCPPRAPLFLTAYRTCIDEITTEAAQTTHVHPLH